MFELNRAERKALVAAAALLALGAVVRESRTPGAALWAWRPAGSGGDALNAVRADVARGVRDEEEAARPLGPGERLDPNRASEAQLRRLPGIGPARARSILEARRSQRFRTPDDLLSVPGIGPATLARMAGHLDLAGRGPVPGRSARAGGPRPAAGGAPGADRPGCDGVDPNRATEAELERLPWIGPTRARGILEARERLGRFRSVDQLVEVPGIGPYTLERLRPYVCLR